MKRVAIVLSVIVLAACPTDPRVGREFRLAIHESTAVRGTPYIVKFDSVLEDSRCPLGAMCIQAGRAKVRLNVTYATGPDILMIVDLTSTPDSSRAFVPGGYFVDYIELLPLPAVGRTIDPDRRSVRLVFRQALD